MFLEKLMTRGLKAHDLDLDLGPLTAIVGPNGSGKTEVQIALNLLAFGTITAGESGLTESGAKVPRTAEGIMAMARDDRLEVAGTFRTDKGEPRFVRRTWTRGDDGKVSEKIELKGFGQVGGIREKRMLLTHQLGGLTEAWSPGDVLQESPEKLRKRILALIPREGLDVAEWVPSDCPDWARPDFEGEDVFDWIHAARVRTGERITVARRELEDLAAQVVEREDGWVGERDPGPVRARLAELREELGRASKAGASVRVDVLRETISAKQALRAAVGNAPALRLFAAIVAATCAARRKDLAALNQRASEHDRARRDHAGRLRALLKVEPGTEADHQAAVEAFEGAKRSRLEASAAVERLAADLRALGGDHSLAKCPECGADLHAYLERRRGEVKAERDRALSALTALEDAEAKAAAARDRAWNAWLRTKADEEERALDAAGLALQAEVEAFPLADIEAAEGRGEMAMRDLRHAEQLDQDIGDLDLDLEIAEADVAEASAGARSGEEIERDIEVAQGELEKLGERNRIARDLELRKKQKAIAEQALEELQSWAVSFRTLEQTLLEKTRGWLEERLSATATIDVRVELEDARGNPTCRLAVAGAPAPALSGGELAVFLSGLVVTLAKESKAPWKVLRLDRFESVSADRRAAFLAGVGTARAEGAIHQAIITGCPDHIEAAAGWQVVRLGDAMEVAA